MDLALKNTRKPEMLDSIYVGLTGLAGYSRGLRVIANNTANMNTPGFKSSSLQFSDMFYSAQGATVCAESGNYALGHGLNTGGTALSFTQGDLKKTGNALDLAVDGDGLFVLKKPNGDIRYTRSGQFEFNARAILVVRGTDTQVMARNAAGKLVEISNTGMKTAAAKATTKVTFKGNLSSTASDQDVPDVKVIDSTGAEHTLSLKLTNTNTTKTGSWSVELLDGSTSIGTGEIVFEGGMPKAESSTVHISYTPSGAAQMPVALDFGTDVTSYASGGLSVLAVASQDGHAPSALSKISFDAQGFLVYTYANAETAKGSRLALSRFDSIDSIEPAGANEFRASSNASWESGHAGVGSFGTIEPGVLEISNVDLSREFGDLVIMQRGYQANSQIVSTANEMLQQLFAMRSK